MGRPLLEQNTCKHLTQLSATEFTRTQSKRTSKNNMVEGGTGRDGYNLWSSLYGLSFQNVASLTASRKRSCPVQFFLPLSDTVLSIQSATSCAHLLGSLPCVLLPTTMPSKKKSFVFLALAFRRSFLSSLRHFISYIFLSSSSGLFERKTVSSAYLRSVIGLLFSLGVVYSFLFNLVPPLS